VAFQSLGVFLITSGTIRVVLANDANNFVIADAVRVVPATPVLDNRGANYSQAGTWTNSTVYAGYVAGYGGDYSWSAAGAAPSTAPGRAAGLVPGGSAVGAPWVPDSNRATNAPYRIYDGTTLIAPVRVDQTKAPSGVTAGGVVFQSLGIYSFTSGT